MSQPAAPVHRLAFRRVWVDEAFEVEGAEPEVAALLTDIDGWPSWTPDLPAIHRRGASKRFVMVLRIGRVPALRVPCKLYASRPGYLEWGGGGPGARIRHRFEWAAAGPERTSVRHVEYATSYLALILLPFERLFHRHDTRWSAALRERFSRARA